MSRLLKLRNVIDRADQCYFYGTPIIEDAAYDALKKELKSLMPDDPRLTRYGYPVSPDSMLTKVKHKTFTGSLSKCDTEADFRSWCEKINCDLLVALKADGNSLVLYYENGDLVRAVTRGGDDGVGEDVTANAIRHQGVPTTLPQPLTCAVRGESILPVANWLKVDLDQHSNPRNIGSGLLRRVSGAGAEHLRFLAFDVDHEDMIVATELDKLMALEQLGFEVIPHWVAASQEEALQRYAQVVAKREKLDYWCDGVVFKAQSLDLQRRLGYVSGRPKAQTVLKFEAEGAVTTFKEIVVTVGHTGAIIPTGKVEPVRIGGTTVTSVLLNNYDEIDDLDLRIGSTVRVIKAKDIIPKLVEVIDRPANSQPIKAPTACPSCGGKVTRRVLTGDTEGTGRQLECKNQNCPARSIAKIKNWITKLDIQGIGDEVLAQLVSTLELKSPADLYRLEPDMIADLAVGNGRLGAKRAAKIIDQIQKKRSLSLHMFLGSLGVPHLGRRRVQLIQKAVPGQLDKLEDWRSGKLLRLADEAAIPNIGSEIQEGIVAFGPVIDDLLTFVTIESAQPKKGTTKMASTKLESRVFCFTGKIEKTDGDGKRFTRDRMQELVRANGGGVSDDVTKETTDLVQADPTSKSSKSEKAKKLGVNILAEADFFALVGG